MKQETCAAEGILPATEIIPAAEVTPATGLLPRENEAHALRGPHPIASALSAALDPALQPFLQAGDEAAEERSLEGLINGVEPRLRAVIRRKGLLFETHARNTISREQEWGEDVCREAQLRLLEQLRRLKLRRAAGDQSAVISSFAALGESITRNLLHEHLRRKYPSRARLQNQLLYVIRTAHDDKTRQPRFALWPYEAYRLCGLLVWLNGRYHRTTHYQKLCDDPSSAAYEALPGSDPRRIEIARLLEALFGWVQVPIDLDDLVSATAQLRGVEDQKETSLDQRIVGNDEDDGYLELPSDEPTPAEHAEQRASLRTLWSAIGRLPQQQCAVLLLNLTDHQGRSVVDLLPGLGIASIAQIAEAVGLEPHHLAELWPRLPLDDKTLAGMLNCPSARVAVWRHRARERLQKTLSDGD